MRSFFRFSSACVFLDARMSLQPLSKRQWARAFPIPEDAPVSTTTCRTEVHNKSRGFIIHLLKIMYLRVKGQTKRCGISGKILVIVDKLAPNSPFPSRKRKSGGRLIKIPNHDNFENVPFHEVTFQGEFVLRFCRRGEVRGPVHSSPTLLNPCPRQDDLR